MKRLLLKIQHGSILALCFFLFNSFNAIGQTTWLGTIDADWTKAGNWTAGVPGIGDDIVIGTNTTNAVLPGGSYFTSITLNIGSQLSMSGNATAEVLEFAGNNAILNTGNYTLTLEGYITGETHESYLNGNLEISRTVSSIVQEKFGDIGVNFDNKTPTNWGNITVTRTTGTAVNQGIKRTWNITPTIAANANVELTLSWLTSEDNGINYSTTKAQVWKKDASNPWQAVGTATLAPATSNVRSMTVQTTSFSSWTISAENNPLPVTWLYFNGNNTAAGTKLNWATVTEKNSSAFIIERSENGKTFEAIGEVKASGNSNQETIYSYTDKRALTAAQIYYRLKQTDLDGTFTYSTIIAIAKNKQYEKLEASAFPNPFSETLNLRLANTEVVKQLTLTTIEGKKVYNKKVASLSDLTLTELPALPAGVYLLKVTGTSNSSVLKVIRQ